MSYGRLCIGGVHVFRMAYLTIFCVLLCFTEGHGLVEVMLYLRVCIIGVHVLLFKMSYWSTCFTGVPILQDDLLYRFN